MAGLVKTENVLMDNKPILRWSDWMCFGKWDEVTYFKLILKPMKGRWLIHSRLIHECARFIEFYNISRRDSVFVKLYWPVDGRYFWFEWLMCQSNENDTNFTISYIMRMQGLLHFKIWLWWSSSSFRFSGLTQDLAKLMLKIIYFVKCNY